MGIIGILAYPKIKSKSERGNRRVPLPFRGKRAENCTHNEEKSFGEGLAHKFSYRRKDGVFLRDVEELTFLIIPLTLKLTAVWPQEYNFPQDPGSASRQISFHLLRQKQNIHPVERRPLYSHPKINSV